MPERLFWTERPEAAEDSEWRSEQPSSRWRPEVWIWNGWQLELAPRLPQARMLLPLAVRISQETCWHRRLGENVASRE